MFLDQTSISLLTALNYKNHRTHIYSTIPFPYSQTTGSGTSAMLALQIESHMNSKVQDGRLPTIIVVTFNNSLEMKPGKSTSTLHVKDVHQTSEEYWHHARIAEFSWYIEVIGSIKTGKTSSLENAATE